MSLAGIWSSKLCDAIAKEKKKVRDRKFKDHIDSAVLANDSRTKSNTATEILTVGPREIVKRIERKEWTAVQVLDAYIERTIEAQEKTNCVTEVMFKEAREEAVVLDAEFARTGKPRGPLHGVPVSFKDCWNIKDLDSSIGLSKFTRKPADEDAEIVKIVRAAGGIPYVKTNTCQTMMTFECDNPIWGRTSSPHNPEYTCGGSSGGEAALIAMDGSPLGFGSDIGGSLRIPAAYCGTYAFKPTPSRVSLDGHASTLHGFEHVSDSAGPMARSVDDLKYACELIFGEGSLKDVTPMPFRKVDMSERKMRFGYYLSDGYVKASPACQRAVRETVTRLTAAGHVCKEISVPESIRAVEIYAGLLAADGYKTLFKAIGQDPLDSGLFLTTVGPRIPGGMRSLIASMAQHLLKDNISARSLRSTRTRSVHETWKLVEEREEYKKLFYSEIWDNQELNLDGIIAPVQALPQAPHGTCKIASFLACGTFLYNLLSLPAGVIPVTHVDPQQDKITPEWSDAPSRGSRVFENTLYGKRGLYNPDDAAGLPVSIQVVGRQWEDEKVLEMMNIVDAALGQDRGFGPGLWKG